MKPSPFSNLAWLIGERALRVGLTATVFALVARYLAPADFAHLNLALTFTALATAIAGLGLEGLVVHELVRRPADPGRVLGTALWLRAASSFVALVLLTAFAVAGRDWRPALGPILLAGVSLLFSPADVIDLFFQRHLESRRTVTVRLSAVFLGAGLRLSLIAADAPVAAFAGVQAIEAAAFASLLVVSLRRSQLSTGSWRWDATLARSFLRRGLPLAVSGLVVTLALRADQFLVLGQLGRASAGVYFASTRLVETALLAGTAFTLSLFPRLSEGHAIGTALFSARLQAIFDAMSALGWLAAIGTTLSAEWLIPALFGEAYRAAVPALIAQSWGLLVALNAAARWQYILVAAPTWLNLACALLGVGTQFAVTPWLMARFGITGAALGWSLAVALSGWGTSFLFPALRPVAMTQTRGLVILFAPARWRGLIAQFL